MNENKINLISVYQEWIRQVKINLEYEYKQMKAHILAMTAMKKSILKYQDKIKELNAKTVCSHKNYKT